MGVNSREEFFMTLLEQLRAKLGPELMGQVQDAVGDDFDWDVVPRSRLNTVIGQRNALRIKLEGLETSKSGEEEDNEGSGTKKTETKKTVKEDAGAEGDVVENLKAEHAKEIAAISKRYAVLDKIRGEKAKDPELVLGQLDLDKITLGEGNTLEGLDEMLTSLKESHGYLFDTDDGVPSGTGKNSGDNNEGDVDPFDAVIASYTAN